MKIYYKFLFTAVLFVSTAFGVYGQKPKISATDGTATYYEFEGAPAGAEGEAPIPCSVCSLEGWIKGAGSPDVGVMGSAGANERTTGGGATWIDGVGNAYSLPKPPNDHDHWMVVRDVGTVGGEESVHTEIKNLKIGREYEVIVYALTARTKENGYNNFSYGQEYMDAFTFYIERGVNTTIKTVNLDPNEYNVWETKKLRFIAVKTTEDLYFKPGHNANIAGLEGKPKFKKFEPLNLSVTIDAINEAPLAQNDTKELTGTNNTVVFKVVDDANTNQQDGGAGLVSDVTANDGEGVQIATVDLNPATDAIDHTFTNEQGTWSYEETSGEVTFTKNPNYVGEVASIQYTVKDNYKIWEEKKNAFKFLPATSNIATLEVHLDTDEDGIADINDLDDDNDGILDVNETEDCDNQNITGVWKNNSGVEVIHPDLRNDIVTAEIGNGIKVKATLITRKNEYEYETQPLTNNPKFKSSSAAYNYVNGKYPLKKNYTNGEEFKIEFFNEQGKPVRVKNPYIYIDQLGQGDHATKLTLLDGLTWSKVDGVNFDNITSTTLTGVYGAASSARSRGVLKVEGVVHTIRISAELVGNLSTSHDSVWMIFSACPPTDTDGDGIPNYLDLDSDGDGCADAKEGAADLTPNDIPTGVLASQNMKNLGNAVNTTTGVPTVAGAGQGVGQSTDVSKNDCFDSDGDGVPDWKDLDNDNDGILDTDEGVCATQIETGNWNVQAPDNDVATSTTNGIEVKVNFVSGATSKEFDAGTNRKFNTTNYWSENLAGHQALQRSYFNNDIIEISFTKNGAPVKIKNPVIHLDELAGTNTSGWFSSKLNLLDGLTWSKPQGATDTNFTVTPTQAYAENEAGGKGRGSVEVNGIVSSVKIKFTTPNEDGIYMIVTGCLPTDTDGDGTPNYLDLDSDGDGCADAKEGAGDLSPNSTPAGALASQNMKNLGNDVEKIDVSRLGAPKSAGAGQGIGQSQDASKNDCIDSDGDNVPDWKDLDDDNDGILDADEQENCIMVPGSGFGDITNNKSSKTGVTSLEGGVVSSIGVTDGDSDTSSIHRYYLFNSNADELVLDMGQVIPVGTVISFKAYGGTNTNISIAESSDNTTYSDETIISTRAGWKGKVHLLTSDARYLKIKRNGNGDLYLGQYSFSYPTFNSGNCTDIDSDGDGIPNRLDLDSDNDNCPDAIEGGNNLSLTNLVEQQGTLSGGAGSTVTKNLGNNVATTGFVGVPVIVGSGQSKGDAVDSSMQSANCTPPADLDPDDDGVAYNKDLDSDNDGILDTKENEVCASTTEPTNADASSTSSTINWSNSDFEYFVHSAKIKSSTLSEIRANTDGKGYVKSGFEHKLFSEKIPYTIMNDDAGNIFTYASGSSLNRPEQELNEIKFADGTVTYKGTGNLATLPSAPGRPQKFALSSSGAIKSGNNNGDAIYVDIDNYLTQLGDNYRVDINFNKPIKAFSFDANDILDPESSGSNKASRVNIYVDNQLQMYFKGRTVTGAPANASEPTTSGKTSYKLYDALTNTERGDIVMANESENTFGFISKARFKKVSFQVVLEEKVAPSRFYDWIGIDNFVYSYDCDTDNDGIPNYLDLDSDNDGCLDAEEGDANITPNNTDIGDLANQTATTGTGNVGLTNITKNDVNGNGVPNDANAGAGQGIGGSQAKLEYQITKFVAEVKACVGETVEFKATATSTPLKTLNYQWQESTDNGANWTDVSGASGTVESGAAAKLTLTNVSEAMNGNTYKVVYTHEDNSCGIESEEKLVVKPKPKFTVVGTPAACADEDSQIEITITSEPAEYVFWLLNGATKLNVKKESDGKYKVADDGLEENSFTATSSNKKIIIKLKESATYKVMMRRANEPSCECDCK